MTIFLPAKEIGKLCFFGFCLIKIASIFLCIYAKFVGRRDHFHFSFNLLSSIQLYPILSLRIAITGDDDNEGTADGKSSLMIRVRGTQLDNALSL